MASGGDIVPTEGAGPIPVLPYRRKDLPARNFSRLRLFGATWLCAVMIGVNVIFGILAIKGYRHAASLPAQRVTAVQKLERAIVRTARGFEKTYASRGALVTALTTSLLRVSLYGVLVAALLRATREDMVSLSRLRLACYGLILTAPLSLVAWFFFTHNLSRVRESFGLLGDFLGIWANSYALIIMGVSASTAFAIAMLRYFRADRDAPV